MTNKEFLYIRRSSLCMVSTVYFKDYLNKFDNIMNSEFIKLYEIDESSKNREVEDFYNFPHFIYNRYKLVWVGRNAKSTFLVLPETKEEDITLFLLESDNLHNLYINQDETI